MLTDRTLKFEWLPDLHQLAASVMPKHSLPINGSSSSSAESSVPRRLFSRSVPFAVLQELPERNLSWHVALYEEIIAILTDSQLLIARHSNEQSDHPITIINSMAVDDDPHPEWRKLAWSPDGRFIAVTNSNGNIYVFHRALGALVYRIQASAPQPSDGPKETHAGATSLKLKRSESTRAGNFTLSQFFIDPVAAIIFIDQTHAGRLIKDTHGYEYELLTITYDGTIRCYLLKSDCVEQENGSTFTIHLEEKSAGCPLTFHHKFRVKEHHATLCAQYSKLARVLCIGGKGKSSAVDSPVSFWRLIAEPPYYSRLSEENDGSRSIETDKSKSYLQTFGEAIGIYQSEDAEYRAPLNFETLWSVFVDWKSRNMKFLSDAVHSLEISEDGKDVISVAFNGDVKRWIVDFRNESSRIKNYWTNEEIVGLVSGENNESIIVAATNFWSATKIGVMLSNGTYSVLEISGELKHLFRKPEMFESNAKIFGIPRSDRVYVLGCELKPVRLRARKDGSILGWNLIDKATDIAEKNMEQKNRLALRIAAHAFSALMKPVRYFTDTFLWNFDTDAESLKIFEKKILIRVFRFHQIAEVSAQMLLFHKISDGKFNEALELAEIYCLDKDPIFKEQWLQSTVNEKAIEDYLDKITDTDWIRDHCLDRICNNAEQQEILYKYAISFTQDAEKEVRRLSTKGNGSLPKEIENICRIRLCFLHYLDRLNSCREIIEISQEQLSPQKVDATSNRSFFAEAFLRFRDVDLVAQAIYYASVGAFQALAILFTRHGEKVLPYRFSILNNIPETFPPESYSILLPRSTAESGEKESTWIQHPWREEKDWVEYESVSKVVSYQPDSINYATAIEYPTSVFTLEKWYAERARAIDSLCGRIDLSLELIRAGIENGIPGLGSLYELCFTLTGFVYDPLASSISHFDVDLSEFEQENLEQKIAIMLQRGLVVWNTNKDSEILIHDIRNHILPFLGRSESIEIDSQPDMKIHLFSNLTELAKKDLELGIVLAESSKPTSNDPILPSKNLAYLLATSCLESDREDHWHIIKKIMKAFPQSQAADFQDQLQKINSFIEIADLLDSLKFPVSISRLSAISGDLVSQRKLLVKISRSALTSKIGTSPPVDTLLETLLKIRSVICPLVEKREIIENFTTQLLANGNPKLLGFARIILFPNVDDEDKAEGQRLPPGTVERLIFEAYQEYFDNASSGNLQEGYLKRAKICLDIVPMESLPRSYSKLQDSVKREMAFLEAVHSICTTFAVVLKPGIETLPIHIRLESDKLIFVKLAIQSDSQLYRKRAAVLDLTRRLLRLDQSYLDRDSNGALLIKAKLNHYMCIKAIELEDSKNALTSCDEMVDLYSKSLCHAAKRASEASSSEDIELAALVSTCCFEVAANEHLCSTTDRFRLNSFALTILPENASDNGMTGSKITIYDLAQRSLKLGKLKHGMRVDDFAENPDLRKELFSTADIQRHLFYYPSTHLTKFQSRQLVHGKPVSTQLMSLADTNISPKVLGILSRLSKDAVEAFLISTCVENVNEFAEKILSIDPVPNNLGVLGLICISWHILKNSGKDYKMQLSRMSPKALIDYANSALKSDPENPLASVYKKMKETMEKNEKSRILQEICKDPNVDGAKFEQDQEYRRNILLQLSKSPHCDDAKMAITFAGSYCMDPVEFALNHMKSVVMQEESNHSRFANTADNLFGMLDSDAQRQSLQTQLKNLVFEMAIGDNMQLATELSKAMHSVLCVRGESASYISQLSIRTKLLERLSCGETFGNIRFLDLILMRYGCMKLTSFSIRLADSEELFRNLGIFRSIDSTRAFSDIITETNFLTLCKDVPIELELMAKINDACGDEIPAVVQISRQYLWKLAFEKYEAEIFAGFNCFDERFTSVFCKEATMMDIVEIDHLLKSIEHDFFESKKPITDKIDILESLLAVFPTHANGNLEKLKNFIDVCRSLSEKELNKWFSRFQELFSTVDKSTAERTIFTLLNEGCTLKVLDSATQLNSSIETVAVYREYIRSIEYSNETEKQGLFRVLESLRFAGSHPKFESIWSIARSILKDQCQAFYSLNSESGDSNALTVISLLKEFYGTSDELTENGAKIKLVLRKTWADINMPKDIQSKDDQFFLMKQILSQKANTKQKACKLMGLLFRWNTANENWIEFFKQMFEQNFLDIVAISRLFLKISHKDTISAEDEKQFISNLGIENTILFAMTSKSDEVVNEFGWNILESAFEREQASTFDFDVFENPLITVIIICMGGLSRLNWASSSEVMEIAARSLLRSTKIWPASFEQFGLNTLSDPFDQAYHLLVEFCEQKSASNTYYRKIAIRLSQLYLGIPDVLMQASMVQSLVNRILTLKPRPLLSSAKIDEIMEISNKVLCFDPNGFSWSSNGCSMRISVLLHSFLLLIS